MLTETAATNLTITAADLDRARAILEVEAKTQGLLAKVPKAGNGHYGLTGLAPEGSTNRCAGVIRRGEAGTGDDRKFTMALTITTAEGKIIADLDTEIVIVARRGGAKIDMPGLDASTAIGQEMKARIYDSAARSHAEGHALAWRRFMIADDPRGYEFSETPQGWVWRREGAGAVDIAPAQNTAADIAASMQAAADKQGHTGITFLPIKPDRAAARAGAWADCLERDAQAVADILAMAGLWPEAFDPETSTYKAPSGPMVELDRVAWIRGWSLLDRGLATAWAVAVHLDASDNEGVAIPPRPDCLDRERPA